MTAGAPVRTAEPLATFSWRGIRRGVRAMAPLALVVLPLGASFGMAALQAGVGASWALAMSATVFAGASQFAALELWRSPLPIGAICIAALAVNARHLLLGASIYPWLSGLRPWKRHLAVTVLSDANWAWSVEAHKRGERDVGVLFGGGLIMWVTWLAGTALGAAAARSLETPERLGLDVLMPAFFAAVLVEGRRSRADYWTWGATAVALTVAASMVPVHWQVLVAAVVGGLVGMAYDQ